MNNTAADFLSRIDSEVNQLINDEYEFVERFIYNIQTEGTLYDELKRE